MVSEKWKAISSSENDKKQTKNEQLARKKKEMKRN